MSMVINSNIMSLTAQRSLTSSQADQNQAMERLSTGKRINSASDDAAGLSISNRMTSQINGLDQAVRNANDGISLIQTAEGALDESTNILQRMRELSVQSANGTYDSGNRGTINAEAQQLIQELDRNAETTSFNGQNVLDGSLGTVSLQVGSEANQTIEFSIGAMDSKSLGLGSTSADISGGAMSSSNFSFSDGDVKINGTSIGSYDSSTDSMQDLLDNISSIEGVEASGFNAVEGSQVANSNGLESGKTFVLTLGGVDGGSDTTYTISGSDSTTSAQGVADAINNQTGGAITAAIGDDGKMSLSNSTGGTITVSNGTFDQSTVTGITGGTYQGSIALTSTNGEAISVTAGSTEGKTALANMGFREVNDDGAVQGGGLSATNQNAQLKAGDLTINGVAIAATDSAHTSLNDKVNNINAASSDTGVHATAVATESFDMDLSGTVNQLSLDGSTTLSGSIEVNGATVSAGASMSDFATNINNAGVGVEAYVDDSGDLQLTSDSAITLTQSGSASAATAATYTVTGAGSLAASSDTFSITMPGGTGQAVDLSSASDINDVVDAINTAVGSNVAAANGSDIDITAGTAGAGTISFTQNGSEVGSGVAGTDATAGGVSPASFTDIDGNAVASATPNAAVTASSLGNTGSISLNGTNVNIDLSSNTSVVNSINDASGTTGVTASIDDNGQLNLKSNSNINIALGDTNGGATAEALGLDIAGESVQAGIQLESTNGQAISVEVTSNGATATGLLNMNTDLSGTVTGNSVSSLDLSTAAGAQSAIGTIDNALDTINGTRGDLGAVNNRLDFTINNLSNISENVTSAKSRIEDADYAEESANLSRAQVLQQAGTAMLAQANSAPQNVLSLLQ